MTTNSFGTKTTLTAGGKTLTIFKLPTLAKQFPSIARLPYSMKILLENLLRTEDGSVVRAGDIEAIFGPAEKMSPAELMQLVTGMRTKLHEQWQDPKVQQDAGSNVDNMKHKYTSKRQRTVSR